MKKLLIVAIMLIGFASLQAQQRVNLSFFKYGTAKDSMTITQTNAVYAIFIDVPSVATDSVEVWGNAKTIGAKDATKITRGPGQSISIGDGKMLINYLYIVIRAGSRPEITTETTTSK